MAQSMEKYHVDMGSYRLIGWGWFAFCVAGLLLTLWYELYSQAAVAAVAALFGAYMALNSGTFDIDNDGITRTSSFGRWRIRWDEITRVEIAEVEGTMVLHGDNKRFILSSPGGWDATVKDAAFAFVSGQLEARNLPPQPSGAAAYKFMKNTRIPKR